MPNRAVASLLLFSMALLQVQPAIAQASAAPAHAPAQTQPSADAAPPSASTFKECCEHGRTDGRHMSTQGAFAIGFGSGLFFGPIGTAVAYTAQSEPEPSARSAQGISDAQCRTAYAGAFGKEGMRKKRRARPGSLDHARRARDYLDGTLGVGPKMGGFVPASLGGSTGLG